MSFLACILAVTMQAQRETPADLQCKDKFLLQSVVVPDGVTTKDITPEMVRWFSCVFFGPGVGVGVGGWCCSVFWICFFFPGLTWYNILV